jgi:hypothetical protein
MRIRIDRSGVFKGSSFVIHIHGCGCFGQKEGVAVDAQDSSDPGCNPLRDRCVSIVQKVVDSGLRDADGRRQCPHAERASGCSLHELAEESAVGEFEALVRHTFSLPLIHVRGYGYSSTPLVLCPPLERPRVGENSAKPLSAVSSALVFMDNDARLAGDCAA